MKRTPGRFFIMIMAIFGVLFSALPALADVVASFKSFQKGASTTVDHSIWDGLLKTYVHKSASGLNEVDYKAFKRAGHKALKKYLRQLQATNVKKLDRDEQFAYWANLYNAKTIDVILQRYPVSSIKKIKSGLFSPGPWKLKILKVNGVTLTLNDVEHGILRKIWRDPRVHYAVNCASIGCPNLARNAFTGKKLQTMLDKGARDYINSPRGARVKNGRVFASKIYSWFNEDFGGNERGVLKHLLKYAKPALAKKLKAAGSIYSYQYDWSLNDVRR
ncbi:MAG: DUF547 domain-containing protein [Hyphomicrobiaceae bacterium]|nr:DUF547 domain-containing protein [Hyphomicrobiaceae bacterium]